MAIRARRARLAEAYGHEYRGYGVRRDGIFVAKWLEAGEIESGGNL